MYQNKQHKIGFTLVEAMIVVSIIVVLATIALPNLLRSRIVANESFACTTLKTISSALENYFGFENEYPNDPDLLIGDDPPYLNTDYFEGIHSGYEFEMTTLTELDYLVTATPASSSKGDRSFTISTGGVFSEI